MPSYLTIDMYYELIKHLDLHIIEPTYDKCKEESLKYKSKYEFIKSSKGAYSSSLKHGWLDEICSHMEIRRKYNIWNKETCHQEALKYTNRKDFQEFASGAWAAAVCAGAA